MSVCVQRDKRFMQLFSSEAKEEERELRQKRCCNSQLVQQNGFHQFPAVRIRFINLDEN